MKRDQSHHDHIIAWAKYVKENPNWKAEHTRFINAVIEKTRQAHERLKKTPQGREALVKLYSITNQKDYLDLFRST